MFKDYVEVRSWLEQFIPLVYGKEELGLKRIEYLLKLLGNPERQFKSIHVAGTSGKGSTAFYVAKLLQDIGGQRSRIGLHISPHLVDIRERMQVFQESKSNFVPISRFLKLFNEIKPIVETIQKEKSELTPSYFEILVAASFKYFAEEKVDWAVVEVGLGGRLDATNVLTPEVSVITNIGLDHTEILGDTVEKIAGEKAGIIKPGVPVVTGATGGALKVIEGVARVQNSEVKVQKFESKVKSEQNIQLAVAAVECLGFKVEEDQVKKLKNIKFPGRFEEIDDGVILDGAHNPDKIKSLIGFAQDSKPKQIALVLAFKSGKDWKKMIDLLIGNFQISSIIATQFQVVTDTGKGSAVDPKEIAAYIEERFKKIKVRCLENSQEAVLAVLQSEIYEPKATIILVTGSLYLVGEVRTMWHLPTF